MDSEAMKPATKPWLAETQEPDSQDLDHPLLQECQEPRIDKNGNYLHHRQGRMSIVKNSGWLLSIATLLVVALPIATASFDFFKLSIQWPPAFKYPGFTPSPLNFTINGLWPHNLTTSAPLPCKAQAPYTSVTGAFLGRLQKSWPNVQRGTKLNQKFWEHEWDHHGGCSETTYNQMAYLTLAADLNDKHNILFSLRAANITRGSSASLLAFEQAIKSHTTKWPAGVGVSLGQIIADALGSPNMLRLIFSCDN